MKEHELEYTAQISSIPRNYLPGDFKVKDWESLEPYFKELLERPVDSRQALEKWLTDLSEVEAVVGEDAAWRQIKMTCDTENKTLEDAFTYFVMEIQPRIQPYADKINRKLVDNPFTSQLDSEAYKVYLRNVRKNRAVPRREYSPAGRDLRNGPAVWRHFREDEH